ncbi:MAG: hypothetical protein QOH09_4839 [Pseudonocardiales bacterium]|nr:hypothetical protein [Pseudonocardiales bacterium]
MRRRQLKVLPAWDTNNPFFAAPAGETAVISTRGV